MAKRKLTTAKTTNSKREDTIKSNKVKKVLMVTISILTTPTSTEKRNLNPVERNGDIKMVMTVAGMVIIYNSYFNIHSYSEKHKCFSNIFLFIF